MKYLLLVHHNEDRFKNMPEGTRNGMLAESIQLCHQLDGKGQYVHASPLQPEATATIVRVRDGESTVTDGPFMETKNSSRDTFWSMQKIKRKPSALPNEYLELGSALSKSDQRWK